MTLTGPQIDRVVEVIRHAYNRDELRRVLRVCMEEEFDDLVADKAYAAQVFELVTWANRQDRALDLLRCAYEHNRTNEGLRLLWLELAPAGSAPRVATASDIFLSFSHHEMELAKRLCADLEAAGFTVWTDGQLAPGTQNWQDAIEAAIENCRCMVVVMTPHAKASRWVRVEVDLAQELERPVVPLLADGERKDAVLFSLRDIQFLDARSDYAGVVQARLIPVVFEFLGAAQDDAPPVAAPTAPVPTGVQQSATGFLTPPLGVEWITIQASEFLMGSDRSIDLLASDDETPPHKVYLPEYCISKYPITNAQYREFVGALAYEAPSHWNGGMIPEGRESHPVVNVTWQDAQAYCAWASSITNFSIRLPTEAEWEKAARSADGRIWPWGNRPPTSDLCNCNRNEHGTTAVGMYPQGASPYGAMDMAGNVCEWTSSEYGRYEYNAANSEATAVGSKSRILRGGSWHSVNDVVRCAYRFIYDPNQKADDIGFRIAFSGS